MVYDRLKGCINVITNIPEAPRNAPQKSAASKLFQASERILRITLLRLCIIFKPDLYFVFCYFAVSPVEHVSRDFLVGSRGSWTLRIPFVLRSCGSRIFEAFCREIWGILDLGLLFHRRIVEILYPDLFCREILGILDPKFFV